MASVIAAMETRYEASMVLAAVGDALGYFCGTWEFCFDGEEIHRQLASFGGLSKIKVKAPKWIVSDDTVMLLATADSLINKSKSPLDRNALYRELVLDYQKSMRDMAGRAPGGTCQAIRSLNPHRPNGHHTEFNKRGGGCGAAMRSMCIGLRFPREEELDLLIAVSIESGRMTHHHPTGYLGALAGALFTSYAIQGKPVKSWGHRLMGVLPTALEYIRSEEHFAKENEAAWPYFVGKWTEYLEFRGIADGESDPMVQDKDSDIKYRDGLYKSWSFRGWGGSSGHDAPMIAYDALLGAGRSWTELCHRGMFHSGDNDSTGVMSGTWFGALYGYDTVPENNYMKVEYHDRLVKAAKDLYTLSREPAAEKTPQEDK